MPLLQLYPGAEDHGDPPHFRWAGVTHDNMHRTCIAHPGLQMSYRQYSDRNREMLQQREKGCSLEELAQQYGLQRTTVKALLVSERHRRSFEPSRLQVAS